MSEALDKAFDKHFGQKSENPEEMRTTDQRSAGREHDALRPRLATEADVKSDKKTRNGTEDVAADRVISGDNSSSQVDTDPMCLTSFGDDSTGPPSLPCSRDDALINKGAAASKPCRSLIEMHTLTAAGGLLSTSTASTATITIFDLPPFWFCLTEEINFRTPILIRHGLHTAVSGR